MWEKCKNFHYEYVKRGININSFFRHVWAWPKQSKNLPFVIGRVAENRQPNIDIPYSIFGYDFPYLLLHRNKQKMAQRAKHTHTHTNISACLCGAAIKLLRIGVIQSGERCQAHAIPGHCETFRSTELMTEPHNTQLFGWWRVDLVHMGFSVWILILEQLLKYVLWALHMWI